MDDFIRHTKGREEQSSSAQQAFTHEQAVISRDVDHADALAYRHRNIRNASEPGLVRKTKNAFGSAEIFSAAGS
jgi:hypothetical protein